MNKKFMSLVGAGALLLSVTLPAMAQFPFRTINGELNYINADNTALSNTGYNEQRVRVETEVDDANRSNANTGGGSALMTTGVSAASVQSINTINAMSETSNRPRRRLDVRINAVVADNAVQSETGMNYQNVDVETEVEDARRSGANTDGGSALLTTGGSSAAVVSTNTINAVNVRRLTL